MTFNKTSTFIVVVFLILSTNLQSQISQGGTPLSFKKDIRDNIDNVFVSPPDMEKVREENKYFEKNAQMWRVSELSDVDFNMKNSGTWHETNNGTMIWRLRITSENAKALSLHYKDFYLPQGSKLFLYNDNKKQVAGAFTAFNNPSEDKYFSTRIIEGETTTLEYIQPAYVKDEPVLNIFQVSYFYRGVNGLIGKYKDNRNTSFGSSGACEVNINCPEGNNWQDEKKGIALIYIPSGMGGGFCTGSLVNNTSEDGTPYFLTAHHCGGSQSNQDMWEFYFNYEASGCNNPGTEPSHDDIIGANVVALGDDSGGSDFLLLELLNSPPGNYGVYYNGWDLSTSGASSSIGIHHPGGDIKKISKGGNLTTDTYTGAMANAHWKVVWEQTSTNWGVTEGGSSGSPVFNENNKKIVGTLTGGAASCNNQTGPDYYGKFDIHWDDNGANNSDQLEPWLDPTNSGVNTLDGFDPNASSGLTADFTASQTNITPGTSISYTDQTSGGTPTSWLWEFEGATPDSSTAQNPTNITYPTAGTYSVTLTASNTSENDQEIKTGYIQVSSGSSLNASFTANNTNLMPGDCVFFQDQSSGNPTSWEWTFNGATSSSSNIQNPNNICYNTPGTYDVTLVIENNASETDSLTLADYITVNDPAVTPASHFTTDKTIVPEGGTVNFTDTSINGPFTSWSWTFEGGMPSTSTDSQPSPIAYLDPGIYDVELTVEDQSGNTYTNLKEDYITVVPMADELPEADFIANYTVISPGESINFHDLSSNTPYNWKWTFESGQPDNSTDNNPKNILYSATGKFDVKLVVENSLGTDTLVKKDYIVVSDTDPCSDTMQTKADFKADNRLISAGERVYFQDMSQNYPASWNWTFEGGSPVTSSQSNPVNGIKYDDPGVYNVTLSVDNICGFDTFTKEDYIYVFSGNVTRYCDTISNLRSGEVYTKINAGNWGSLAGHNSKRIKYYADYYKNYSFTQIDGLVVPVSKSEYLNNSSSAWFYIWSGNTQYPSEDSILVEKRVYIKDMPENFNSVIKFDNPVEVDGPFFAGFKINYPDNNNNGISDDRFVVSVAPDRGNQASDNTMYIKKGGEWKSSVEVFNVATSLAIQPIACLVQIEDNKLENNIKVYPNPTKSKVNITINKEFDFKEIDFKVFDLTGRLVNVNKIPQGKNEFALDFSNKTAGLYYLNIIANGEKISKKISVIR